MIMMSMEGTMDKGVLDDIIKRLLEGKGSKQVQLSEGEIRQLCINSRQIFLSQPTLLRILAPVRICGDIHGQYQDLLRVFEYGQYPPASNYLFLGDYVDRGKHSLETICLLLAYKIRYPDKIFLLRGNHEDAKINRIYGFYDECKRRFNVRLWRVFTDCFNALPVAALIDEKILCMHGGLSPELKSLDQINQIQRPTEIPDSGLLCDLLWSDPDPKLKGWADSDRGISCTFGPDVVTEFLQKNDIDLICRGHQVVEDGYEFFAKRRFVTIFSAPNYGGVQQCGCFSKRRRRSYLLVRDFETGSSLTEQFKQVAIEEATEAWEDLMCRRRRVFEDANAETGEYHELDPKKIPINCKQMDLQGNLL